MALRFVLKSKIKLSGVFLDVVNEIDVVVILPVDCEDIYSVKSIFGFEPFMK